MKLRPILQNKKAGTGLIIFFCLLFGVLIIGFIGAMLWSILDIANDEIYPTLREIGVIEDVNANTTEYVDYGFGVVNTFIASMPWLIAFGYVLTVVFTLVFIYMAGYTPHPAFMGFYFALMLLLIFGCVIMSNIYEDIYQGNDDIGTRLEEQSTMSFLLIHAPLFFTMVAIVGGIIMFARSSYAEQGGAGSFGSGL